MTTLASASDDVIDEAMPATSSAMPKRNCDSDPTSGSSVSDACSMLVDRDAGR